MSRTMDKYDRASRLYDFFELPAETLLFKKFRKKAISLVKGEVLEVGVGTGKNLPYYPPGIRITGIDFSSGMIKKAVKRRDKLRLENVVLQKMDVQELHFDDNTFDTVVSTFVFCTVPDPVKGLKEVLRVLKPGGQAIFLEHMRSENWFINIHLYLMNLITEPLVGTSMLRETIKNIEKAGFKIEVVENLLFDVFRLIIAAKTD